MEANALEGDTMSETTPRPDEPRDPAARAAETPDPETGGAAPPQEPGAATGPEATPAPPPPPDPSYAAPGQPYAPPPPQGYTAPQQYAQAPGYAPAGQAPMSPQEERTWGMATHGITLGAMIITSGILGFVAALVLYLMYRDRGAYIRAQTANALNIQITTVIGVVISFVLMFVLVGFVTIVLVGIYALVLHIIGMVKANNGEWWDPPLTYKFVR